MSSRYKVYDNYQPHFITSTVLNWMDALSRPIYKDIIINSLNYCIQEKGLQLHAWVIMNNHFHLIASAKEGGAIAAIIRDLKKFTSRQIMDAIAQNPQESRKEWLMNAFSYAGRHNNNNEHFQFWQQDFHPIALTNEDIYRQKMEYLHNNPVKEGIVWQPQDYKYSSAIDYYENKTGLLPLIML